METSPSYHPQPEHAPEKPNKLLIDDYDVRMAAYTEATGWAVHGDYVTAARQLGHPHPESIMSEQDLVKFQNQQHELFVSHITGLPEGDEGRDKAEDEWVRQHLLSQHPDLPANASLRDVWRMVREKESKMLDEKLASEYEVKQLENYAASEKRRRITQRQVAEVLGLQYSEENTSWDVLIRRLLNLPLTAAGEHVVERIEQIKPVLDGILPREESVLSILRDENATIQLEDRGWVT